jgi:hypothetical protein
LVPGALKDAEAFLKAHPATQERFSRVTRLVEGFETPFGLELLSTTHWVITREHKEDYVRAVHDWSPRKRQFAPTQIELAAERLRSEGWLTGT